MDATAHIAPNTESMATLIAAHTCPVCKVARTGLVDPRRSLMEHLRRLSKTDAAHKMWKEKHFDSYFRHGGNRSNKTVSAEEVVHSVQITFGDEWAQRVTVA
jgi:hypothetical protein